MADEVTAVMSLLGRQKAKLIGILSADADFVLQHAHSRDLLSDRAYQHVKSCNNPSEKVRDLLDRVIQTGPKAAMGMLDLLTEPEMQKTFPMLDFLKDLHVGSLLSEKTEASSKRKKSELEEIIPPKKISSCRHGLVTEKQLMTVARSIGRTWREIGRVALGIKSVKLEQIEEDNPIHVERVFAMLRHWRNCNKEEATSARLHTLLSEAELDLPLDSIDCLLENDQRLQS